MLILSTISILRGDAWNYAAARWRGRDSDRDSDSSNSPKIYLRRSTADDESVWGRGANVQYEIGLKQVPGNTRQYFSRHPEVWNLLNSRLFALSILALPPPCAPWVVLPS